MCRLSLNICSAKGVLPKGLGGWIYILCDNVACTALNKIFLGKQHKKSVSKEDNPFGLSPHGCGIFDVNTKVASGMLHSGIGERSLNNFLSTLNLSQISHKALKIREVEIGTVMQTFANKSVDAALLKEQELTQKALNVTGPVGIEVSSDVAWKKRGSQRSYNNLSGITSAIGKRSKKIVHYNARYKRCHFCWYAAKHKRSPQKHQSMLNWHGSAKAMVPDMFVEMVNDTAKKGVPVTKVAGDDDHTGINRVRQLGNTNIVKESDKNHVHKNVTKKLHSLQKSHKSLTHKE